MAVQFINNSIKVKAVLTDEMIAYLYEAGESLQSQVADNSRANKGDLRNSWRYAVDEKEGVCTVGSPLENAIWEEFGTGEYAVHGDGRKGGWTYQDEDGKWHHTHGKTPNRAFQSAFNSLKNPLIRRAQEVIGGSMK